VLSEFYYKKTAFIKATGEGSSLWFSFYFKKQVQKEKTAFIKADKLLEKAAPSGSVFT
jgi:hypothetical protein